MPGLTLTFARASGSSLVKGPCRALRVEGEESQSYGPYAGFSLQDGVAFVEHRVFAFADRSLGDWYSHEGGRHWQIMLISPVH